MEPNGRPARIPAGVRQDGRDRFHERVLDCVDRSLGGGRVFAGGCFLVLRRLSMMGDAISHAILPGIVIASAHREPKSLGHGSGRAAVGLLTTFFVQG